MTLCRLVICYPHIGGAFYLHFSVMVVYPKDGLSRLFETSIANHQSKKRRTPDDCNRYQLYDRPTNLIKMRSVVSVVPPDGATARGAPWPPLQCASKPLNSLLCLSIHLNPSSSGPWTRHPAISFLVFLFVLLHTAFRTTSFLELRCLAFFLCDLATVFFGI